VALGVPAPVLSAVSPSEAIATPRAAATVVLIRPGVDGLEVLLTQRPSTMAFAADLHVFPGGAVDPGDVAAEAVARSAIDPAEAVRALGGDADPEAAIGAFVAAIRELWEESDVLLARPLRRKPDSAALAEARAALLVGTAMIGQVAETLDLELRSDLLAPLSRWVTPPFAGRRFDVRFFVAELSPGVQPAFAEREIVAHRWTTPRAALDAMAAGEIGLWVPTSATLQQLEHAPSLESIRGHLAPGASAPIRFDEIDPALVRAVLPGAGGIGGQAVNVYVVGRRELVVVDPGDPSEAAADALLALAAGRDGRIAALAITHADPDHAAGAEALSLRLSVPLFGGVGSGHDLPATVTELADGDPIPVGDVGLVALATPGPRRDHTAFLVAELGIVLAGDLVGPGPSRSIVAPPDVPAWIASLRRVQALGARLLLPGHGEPPLDAEAAIRSARYHPA